MDGWLATISWPAPENSGCVYLCRSASAADPFAAISTALVAEPYLSLLRSKPAEDNATILDLDLDELLDIKPAPFEMKVRFP